MTDDSSIRDLRHQHGIRQKALADLAGISISTLRKIEHNDMSHKLSSFIKVMEALGYRIEIKLKEKE